MVGHELFGFVFAGVEHSGGGLYADSDDAGGWVMLAGKRGSLSITRFTMSFTPPPPRIQMFLFRPAHSSAFPSFELANKLKYR